MSSDEDYYSDRDSLDGLENEDSEFHCTPPKGPTTKVILLFDFVLFLNMGLSLMVLELGIFVFFCVFWV